MASYDLPPWLQGTPDEPAKIFLQAASVGAQIGQGAVANINRARALNEQARQFDAEQQRMAQFDQVRLKLLDQQFELGKVQVATALRAREEQISSENAYSKVAKLMADHSLAGISGTDASEARIWTTIANNPQFYLHPASKDFLAKMQISREARIKASEREDLELEKLSILEAGRAGKAGVDLEKARENIASKERIAGARSETDIKEAEIGAKAKVDAATLAANKWKDHSRFAAYKAGLADYAGLAKRDPDLFVKKVGELYEKLLPPGEPNVMGATLTAPETMSDATPQTQAELDALPSGTVYVNPADGKRYRKK